MVMLIRYVRCQVGISVRIGGLDGYIRRCRCETIDSLHVYSIAYFPIR